MIDKLIKYVEERLNITVSESQTTNSKYLRLDNYNKIVRISDHFGNIKDNVDLTVIVPDNPGYFIVVLGFKTFVYTSFQRTAELIVTYLILEANIFEKEALKIKNQSQTISGMQERINALQAEVNKLNVLNRNLENLNKNLAHNSKESELKKKVERQAAEIQILNEKQAEAKKVIKQKDDAIKEAADLLEDLSTNPELREMVYDSHSGKKYYLDNFAEEAQDMLKDLIKDYYSK